MSIPTYPNPDSFRRLVPSGPIPVPLLLTETVTTADLAIGDYVAEDNEVCMVSAIGAHGVMSFDCGGMTFAGVPMIPATFKRVVSVTFGLLSQAIKIEYLRDDTNRYYGQFGSQYEEYAYETALDSYETAGSCNEMGWLAARVDITTVNGTVYPGKQDPVLSQWSEEIGRYPAGYIVTEDDRGAVSVEWFDSVSELEARWNEYRQEETDYYENEEEND